MGSRLLGSYETELHEIVERVVAAGFDRVIDVGSGDGYYAVGLARRLPASTVEAYDPDPVARRRCRALAEVNGVLDRIDVRDAASRSPICDSRGRSDVREDGLRGMRARAPAARRQRAAAELHDPRRAP